MPNSQKKRSDLWLPEAGGWGRETCKKAVKRYKLTVTREISTRNIIYNNDDCSSHCCMIHRKAVKRVDPKSSHHKEEFFFLFFLLYLYERMVIN